MTEVYLYHNGDIKIKRKGDVKFTPSKFYGSDANGKYNAYRCIHGEEDYYVRRLIRERIKELLDEVDKLMYEHDYFCYLREKIYNGEVE